MKAQLEKRIQEELAEGNDVIVYTLLVEYFESVVASNPSNFPKFLEWRSKIKNKRHRPCLCVEDLSEQSLQTFLKELKTNLWKAIPEKVKPKRIRDTSNYKAEPEDKLLENLVKPFAGTDSIQTSMLGINFDTNGITATNAIKLLFLPKVKKGEKGGHELVTLTVANMPAHSHDGSSLSMTLSCNEEDGDNDEPSGRTFGIASSGTPYNSSANDATFGGGTISGNTGNQGNNQAFDVQNPFLGVNYIIALQGTFPPRN